MTFPPSSSVENSKQLKSHDHRPKCPIVRDGRRPVPLVCAEAAAANGDDRNHFGVTITFPDRNSTEALASPPSVVDDDDENSARRDTSISCTIESHNR